MQGKKEYSEKLFINFRLSEHVPKENFYRRLREALDLSYLSKLTAQYYGTEGQKSIDTEVFFKFMLIGYLENINSDRQIVENAKLRLDMLYFLGYDLDEPLPWHSTLSRTRQLFGEEVFLEFFRNILKMCAEKGMISGKTQAIDSAFIKANASMDSLVERELNEKSKQYYEKITENEEEYTERKNVKTRKRNVKHSDLFVSTSDPDARVSQKQGKLPALNHLGIISVDTENHVICGAMSEFADKNDSDTTEKIIEQTIENLQDNNLQIKEVLADTGYSSGVSYDYLEKQNITAYIPPISGYKPEKEGFIYDEKEDCYICSQGKKLLFKGIKKEKGRKTSSKEYRTTTDDCRFCPLKLKCCKRGRYKQVSHSTDKQHYDKAYKLLNTRKGKQKMRLRGATVEPVWGTLLNFRRLKKVYTIGNDLANKQVLMASAAYNLKKLMGLYGIKSVANAVKNIATDKILTIFNDILTVYELLYWIWKSKKIKTQNVDIYY
jgi:transposase